MNALRLNWSISTTETTLNGFLTLSWSRPSSLVQWPGDRPEKAVWVVQHYLGRAWETQADGNEQAYVATVGVVEEGV